MTSQADWLRPPVLAAALAILVAGPALAESVPAGSKVTDFLLDNGMEVVVIPITARRSLTHMVWLQGRQRR